MAVPLSAAAQPTWLVPVGEPDAFADRHEALRESLAAALAEAGAEVPSAEQMRSRFEDELSLPAALLSQRQIDEWVARSRAAVRNLARTDYDAARADLLEAQALSERAAEELNREANRARQVLDTCLYMVRAFIETGAGDEAERQARQCRRLVPQGEPSRYRHTPEVRELLARLDAQAREDPPGRLRVESTPSGCAVRLNGVQFGQTPFAMEDLTPGDYRLQVECDTEARGRVHRVRLRESETLVEVDAAFDRHVLSRPDVHIAGGDPETLAARLADELDVQVVLLAPTASGLQATLVRTHTVNAPVSVTAATVDQAAAALQQSRPAVVQQQDTETPPGDAPSGTPRWRRATGWALAAVGLGSTLGSVIFHRGRTTRGDQYVVAQPQDLDFLDRQSRWRDLKTPVAALALSGGLLATAGVWVGIEGDGHVPAWAWVAGGLGLASGVGALVVGLSAESCGNIADNREECVDRGRSVGRAWLLAGAALPLLNIPIRYLVGGGGDPDSNETASTAGPELTLAPRAGGGVLALRGHLR